MKEWLGQHAPIALRVQSLRSCIRNILDSVVLDGSPGFDGIAEEHVRKRGDITNPPRFFGGPLRAISNMVQVGLHANKFLEIPATESHLLTEYHTLSQRPLVRRVGRVG
jgi:hypothetical protein